MTVPALSDIVAGKVSISSLRPVELDDLLGRDAVQLDEAGLHAFVDGKVVLVSGAGGSIGSELCRQMARFAPGRIVLLDSSEFALYAIEQEFRDLMPGVPTTAVIGDAKDARRVQEVFARFNPKVVFHAAAYKHVPLMEEENAFQAVANNVLSTLTLGRAARKAGSEKVVLISTDKAVNPANVMGASKRLAELACQAMQPRAPRSSSSCDSATSSARPAAWCRASAPRSRQAGRSRSRTRKSSATSCPSRRRRSSCCRRG